MERCEEYFFQQRCKKMAALNTVLASTCLHCHVAISTVLMKLIVVSPLKVLYWWWAVSCINVWPMINSPLFFNYRSCHWTETSKTSGKIKKECLFAWENPLLILCIPFPLQSETLLDLLGGGPVAEPTPAPVQTPAPAASPGGGLLDLLGDLDLGSTNGGALYELIEQIQIPKYG